ncbi:MAG: glycosyltransferase family 1 protein [Acidobacteria bacterium]|nr:glycosyltransferase family 1 protein [Acidobacteriota bacterium]
MARLAVISYHTSPLAQPGTGDGGGMNVYVRELASAVARQGHEVDVFTRRDSPTLPTTQLVEPGFRVHHVTAGPPRTLERREQEDHVKDFTDGVADHFLRHGSPDALHANYWLSGLAGHRLKHELDLPLIMTFHTLERVKADHFEGESEDRAHQETAIFACADAVLASCDVEAAQFVDYYNADPARVHVVPLGVQHAFFAPGDQRAARQALGRDENEMMLLFVGRLQALKGVDLALETLITLRRRGRDASLAIVGGPSGPEGRAMLAALHQRVDDAGVIEHVSFVAPQSHQLLSTWMRAADVTLVPSRSESFGLVALESSACGTPVVASAVGGLLTLIEPGVNGQLIAPRDADVWADAVEEVVSANVDSSLSNSAVLLAQHYTWRSAAQSLDDLVERLIAVGLVRC